MYSDCSKDCRSVDLPCIQGMAHANAVVTRIAVAGIIDGIEVGGCGLQRGTGDGEKGPQQLDAGRQVTRRAHAGQPPVAGMPGTREEMRLDLVVLVMRSHDRGGAQMPRRVDEQPVARLTRFALKVACRLFALPSQDQMRQAKTLRDRGDKPGLVGSVPAQAVINGDDVETDMGKMIGTCRGGCEESQRVGATGNRQDDALRRQICLRRQES